MTYQAQPIYAEAPPSGAESLFALKDKLQTGLLGFIAYRAGRNHYELHGDLAEAILYGAHAMRRWWSWLIMTQVWLFWLALNAWLFYLTHHDIRGESYPDITGMIGGLQMVGKIGLPITFVLAVAVPYCRNVDYSLFKRRLVYRLFQPLVILLDWVPNGWLYVTILVGLFFPIGWWADPPSRTERIANETAEATAEVCSRIQEGVSIGATGNGVANDLLWRAGVTFGPDGHSVDEWYWEHC
jgi:hypothetical protein